ncbi:MAG: CBS domain-containing protein [Candidatus Diapherotrites archaeon]|nr:CBS domain-containing protein [Candidatus Diapherotrites archaeon]
MNTGIPLPELAEIRLRRQALRMTQAELAQKAGISQGLLAKIECGSVTPSYTRAQKLFSALEGTPARPRNLARELMNSRIVFLAPEATLSETISSMKKKAVSQIPILNGKENLGSVDEKKALSILAASKNIPFTLKKPVAELMDPPLPEIREDAPLSQAAILLAISNAVLVRNPANEFSGIISKTDLLDYLARTRTKTFRIVPQ